MSTDATAAKSRIRTTRAATAPHDTTATSVQHVKIAARLRKALLDEDLDDATFCQSTFSERPNARQTLQHYPTKNSDKSRVKSYQFSKIFGKDHSNNDIFDDLCLPMLEDILLGIDHILFSYGGSMTGKTYTFAGPHAPVAKKSKKSLKDVTSEEASSETALETDGVLLRSILWLLNQENVRSVTLRAVETYAKNAKMVQFYDLCDAENSTDKWNKKKALNAFSFDMCQNMKFDNGTKRTQIYEALQKIFVCRHEAPVSKNPYSSRGHVVFTIEVELTDAEAKKKPKPRFTVIDLAASQGEAVLRRKSVMNVLSSDDMDDRRKESACIKKEITELKIYFIELQKDGVSEWAKRKETKSTHMGTGLRQLLYDCTTVNSKITVLFMLAPTVSKRKETSYTLQFATEAKLVTVTTGKRFSARMKEPPKVEVKTEEEKEEPEEEDDEAERLRNLVASLQTEVADLRQQLDKIEDEHPEIMQSIASLNKGTHNSRRAFDKGDSQRLSEDLDAMRSEEQRLSRQLTEEDIAALYGDDCIPEVVESDEDDLEEDDLEEDDDFESDGTFVEKSDVDNKEDTIATPTSQGKILEYGDGNLPKTMLPTIEATVDDGELDEVDKMIGGEWDFTQFTREELEQKIRDLQIYQLAMKSGEKVLPTQLEIDEGPEATYEVGIIPENEVEKRKKKGIPFWVWLVGGAVIGGVLGVLAADGGDKTFIFYRDPKPMEKVATDGSKTMASAAKR